MGRDNSNKVLNNSPALKEAPRVSQMVRESQSQEVLNSSSRGDPLMGNRGGLVKEKEGGVS